MTTREQVIQRAREVIEENVPDMFGHDLEEDTVLNVDGNVDSMGFILVLTKLEGEFGARIPSNEWDRLRTLGDLADAVVKYMPKDEA